MKSVLEGRIRRAEDIAATFARFKREVCLSAEHSKTGRPVGEKVLQQLEQKGTHADGLISLDCHHCRLAITVARKDLGGQLTQQCVAEQK